MGHVEDTTVSYLMRTVKHPVFGNMQCAALNCNYHPGGGRICAHIADFIMKGADITQVASQDCIVVPLTSKTSYHPLVRLVGSPIPDYRMAYLISDEDRGMIGDSSHDVFSETDEIYLGTLSKTEGRRVLRELIAAWMDGLDREYKQCRSAVHSWQAEQTLKAAFPGTPEAITNDWLGIMRQECSWCHEHGAYYPANDAPERP